MTVFQGGAQRDKVCLKKRKVRGGKGEREEGGKNEMNYSTKE